MDRSRVELGRWGEDLATRHYTAAGYRLIDRNWRGDGGEIDLVLDGGDHIVFCEVKTRSSVRFGAPAEAVDPRKQLRIRALALQWLHAHGRRGDVRFDVASVLAGRVSVTEDAF